MQEITAEEEESRKAGGMYECFHCGARAVGWESDFTFEDLGYDGDGLIQFCTCHNCGAEIEYAIRTDDEEDADESSKPF